MNYCTFLNCERTVRAKGLCGGHYQQKYHGKTLSPLKPKGQNKIPKEPNYCTKKGCLDIVHAKQLCRSHYREQTRDRENELQRKRSHKRVITEARREQKRRRKALCRGASTVEVFTKQQVWDEEFGICGICGTTADMNDWHLDHIIPLSRGGQHTRNNVQVSHPKCNLSKGNKLPSEFKIGGVPCPVQE